MSNAAKPATPNANRQNLLCRSSGSSPLHNENNASREERKEEPDDHFRQRNEYSFTLLIKQRRNFNKYSTQNITQCEIQGVETKSAYRSIVCVVEKITH